MMTPPRSPQQRLRNAYQRRVDLDEQIRALVSECRAEGTSWREIGEALGMTKKLAHYHYGAENKGIGPQKPPQLR